MASRKYLGENFNKLDQYTERKIIKTHPPLLFLGRDYNIIIFTFMLHTFHFKQKITVFHQSSKAAVILTLKPLTPNHILKLSLYKYLQGSNIHDSTN